MSSLSIKDISKAMRDIDICMMTTLCKTHGLDSRPMSNNKDVDYTGDSYFFALAETMAVKQVNAFKRANLSYVARPLLGKDLYISITGDAETTQDRAELEKHWVKDAEVYFEQGLDTPGLTLIKVRATRLQYWHGGTEGEITLDRARGTQAA